MSQWCPRCGGLVLYDYEEPYCMSCGTLPRLLTKGEEELGMTNTEELEREPIPVKPENIRERWAYYEDNKDAMIAGFQSMILKKFIKRWGIATITWQQLKKKWGVQPKKRGKKKSSSKPEKLITPVDAIVEDDGTVFASEHEHYIYLLGYRQCGRDLSGAKDITKQ